MNTCVGTLREPTEYQHLVRTWPKLFGLSGCIQPGLRNKWGKWGKRGQVGAKSISSSGQPSGTSGGKSLQFQLRIVVPVCTRNGLSSAFMLGRDLEMRLCANLQQNSQLALRHAHLQLAPSSSLDEAVSLGHGQLSLLLSAQPAQNPKEPTTEEVLAKPESNQKGLGASGSEVQGLQPCKTWQLACSRRLQDSRGGSITTLQVPGLV